MANFLEVGSIKTHYVSSKYPQNVITYYTSACKLRQNSVEMEALSLVLTTRWDLGMLR